MNEFERDPDEPDPDEDPDAWFEWFKEVIPVDLVERLLAAVVSDEEDAGDDLRELDADWYPVAWTLALLIRGVHNGKPERLYYGVKPTEPNGRRAVRVAAAVAVLAGVATLLRRQAP